jgi:hypothetical protein
MPTPTVADVVAAFEARTLTRAEWTHAQHLRIGLWYLRRHGFPEALSLVRTGIRRLNAALGTDPAAYHETVTRAWLTVVSAIIASHPATVSDDDLAAIVVEHCRDSRLLLRSYRPETLASPAAKAAWIEPDLAPLSL